MQNEQEANSTGRACEFVLCLQWLLCSRICLLRVVQWTLKERGVMAPPPNPVTNLPRTSDSPQT